MFTEISKIKQDLRSARHPERDSPARTPAAALAAVSRHATLVAALVAPLSTLYNIPALSQRWYSFQGPDGYTMEEPDPVPSLILSAVGLTFNLAANGLLVVRFSSNNRRWRIATVLSLCLWVVTTVIDVVNLSAFGTRHYTRAKYSYTEGFWCAVISAIAAGIICLLLLLHYLSRRNEGGKNCKVMRVQGQHFMLSVMWLFSVVALEALIMSRIEHWSFFDGIYFSVATMFTIGLGDFVPTEPLSRVLLFPFALVTIAALGNQIGIIIEFFAGRASARKERWQALYEARKQADGAGLHGTDLEDEMRFLHTLVQREERLGTAWDLAWSLAGFVTFWASGAAVFCAIEGWPYGTSVYFTYVMLLTIGYGDYAPQTPAGRCVFVVYSLMAVPVVASFAMQTVTSIFNAIATQHLQERRAKMGLEPSLERTESRVEDGEERRKEEHYFVSHEEFVRRAHERYGDRFSDVACGVDGGRTGEDEASDKDTIARAHAGAEADARLTDRVLQLAVALEEQARTLLIANLRHGSKERMLLRADRYLQMRDRQYYVKRESEGSPEACEEVPKAAAQQDAFLRAAPEESTLDQIRRYRETFAALLAVGSRLKGLQGEEQYMFERRRVPAGGRPQLDGAVSMRATRSEPL